MVWPKWVASGEYAMLAVIQKRLYQKVYLIGLMQGVDQVNV